MDEARIRELQSLISEGHKECQQACNDWNWQKSEISVALEKASRIEARLLTVIGAYIDARWDLENECKRSGNVRVAELMSDLYWSMVKYRRKKHELDKMRSLLKSNIDELTYEMKCLVLAYNELEEELDAEEDK